jgi:hypothetical protein
VTKRLRSLIRRVSPAGYKTYYLKDKKATRGGGGDYQLFNNDYKQHDSLHWTNLLFRQLLA